MLTFYVRYMSHSMRILSKLSFNYIFQKKIIHLKTVYISNTLLYILRFLHFSSNFNKLFSDNFQIQVYFLNYLFFIIMQNKLNSNLWNHNYLLIIIKKFIQS